jgi:hypothetical protein
MRADQEEECPLRSDYAGISRGRVAPFRQDDTQQAGQT